MVEKIEGFAQEALRVGLEPKNSEFAGNGEKVSAVALDPGLLWSMCTPARAPDYWRFCWSLFFWGVTFVS